jgi:hypothetical protein
MIEQEEKTKRFKERLGKLENQIKEDDAEIINEEKQYKNSQSSAEEESKSANKKLDENEKLLMHAETQAQLAQKHFYMSSNFSNLWLGGSTGIS